MITEGPPLPPTHLISAARLISTLIETNSSLLDRINALITLYHSHVPAAAFLLDGMKRDQVSLDEMLLDHQRKVEEYPLWDLRFQHERLHEGVESLGKEVAAVERQWSGALDRMRGGEEKAGGERTWAEVAAGKAETVKVPPDVEQVGENGAQGAA